MHEQLKPAVSEDPWIEDDLQEVLDSDVDVWHDFVFGQGQAHNFGPERRSFLAFYPKDRMVEYQDPNVIVSPRHAVKITTTEQTVFLDLSTDRQQTFAMASRDGGFTLISKQLTPAYTAHERAVIDHLRAAEGNLPWSAEYPIRQDDSFQESSCLPSTSSPEPLSEPIMEPASPELPAALCRKEQAPKVRLTGRLAQDIHLQQTSRGLPLVRFQVGERPNPDNPQETVWHDVYSTKVHAERIAKEQLRRGEDIRVSGLLQESTAVDPQTGTETIRQSIYAFGAKRIPRE